MFLLSVANQRIDVAGVCTVVRARDNNGQRILLNRDDFEASKEMLVTSLITADDDVTSRPRASHKREISVKTMMIVMSDGSFS